MSRHFFLSYCAVSMHAFWLRVSAAVRLFNAIVPSLSIAVHLLVVATLVGGADCGDTNFWVYWGIMIAITAGLALALSLSVTHPRIPRPLHVILSTACSTLLFVAASFVRAKPFKCFAEGSDLAYVTGPATFGVVFAVTLVYAIALAVTYPLSDLESYVRIGGGESADSK